MKRLNPKTGKEFKRGDIREDGYCFLTYLFRVKKDGFYREAWTKPELFEKSKLQQKLGSVEHNKKNQANPDFRAKCMINAAKTRCKKYGGEVTVTWQWVSEKIKNGKCELTGLPFDLSSVKDGGKNPFSPSIDRINPKNKNYEVGNVRIILQSLNMALSNYGIEHLMFITDAMKLRLN